MEQIKIDHLTKIEGHAGLTVKVDKGKVQDVNLDIIEGARYFEGILKGRLYYEAPVFTSRICGVCPVPHTLASIYAMENILGIVPSKQTKKLRELMLIGEMLESHSLHLYFFVLPDYLGYESAIAMAKDYGDEVKRALRIKKLGNELTRVVAGREVHPISSVIGGFSHLPKTSDLIEVREKYKALLDDVIKAVLLFETLDYPKFERKVEYVALKEQDNFAYMSGWIASTEGLKIDWEQYKDHFSEFVKPYATAKFSQLNGKSYSVGAISRLNLSRDNLTPRAKELLDKSQFRFPSSSPHMNNIAQAVEMVHYVEKALEILEDIEIVDEPLPEIKLKAGRGVGVIEAPRGTLFHEFEIDEKGIITKANVVTPTAQAINNIEQDIAVFITPEILKKPKGFILLELEKLIRSYDPCISCSAHFLNVKWE